MDRIELDGVPVFTAPGPDRISVSLVFGVGARDEPFVVREVTHLIEHLAMGSLPKSHLSCNAMTDVDTTSFFATGRPEAVRAFLEGICRALSDLPLDRMPMEVGVLQAENCSVGGGTAASLWAARYGLAGPGLAVADGPGPQTLTPEAVREHARRWFVRENAALACHGSLPEGLRLQLPSGPRPVRHQPWPRPQTAPVWTEYNAPGVGLLLASTGPWDAALRVGVAVLEDRLRDVARHARGLSYHIESETVDVSADRRETVVLVDAREGQEREVAGIVWQEFSALCEHGPTPEELSHVLEGFAEALDGDPDDVVASDLVDAAIREVSRLPFVPVADVHAAWQAVGRADVVQAFRAAHPSAVLYVPEDGTAAPPAPLERRPICNVVPSLPEGTVFRPPVLARAWSRHARLTLVVSERELGHADADGEVHVIAWPSVEAVLPTDDGEGIVVIGGNMCAIVVHPDLYGRRALDAVRGYLPAGRWVLQPA